MKVYPNPAHDNITIKLGNIPLEQGIIQLYDMQGKLQQLQRMDTRGNVIMGKNIMGYFQLVSGNVFIYSGRRPFSGSKIDKGIKIKYNLKSIK